MAGMGLVLCLPPRAGVFHTAGAPHTFVQRVSDEMTFHRTSKPQLKTRLGEVIFRSQPATDTQVGSLWEGARGAQCRVLGPAGPRASSPPS